MYQCRKRGGGGQKAAARTDVRLLGNSCSSRTRSESAGRLPRISPYRIGTSRRGVCAVSGSLRLPILGSHSLEDLLSVVQNVRNRVRSRPQGSRYIASLSCKLSGMKQEKARLRQSWLASAQFLFPAAS